MRRFLSGWFVALGLLAACDATVEEQVSAACSTLCRCEASPLPAEQRRCVAECEQDVGGFSIPPACLECVTAHADRCATLEVECAPACSITEPPMPGEDFVDAGAP